MAGSSRPIDVEITIISARDLKNVNWKHGDLRAYAVAWVDPEYKVSTKVDPDGDTNPSWNEKLTIPVNKPLEDAEITIDIVHEKPSEGSKPLIGTARIKLLEVLDEVGFDEKQERTLKLRRPSGRPQGKLEIAIRLREKRWPGPQYPPTGYGQPYYPTTNRGWSEYPQDYPSYSRPPGAEYPYAQAPYANPPAGYPNRAAGYPNQPAPYPNQPAAYPNPYGSPYPQSGGPSSYYEAPSGGYAAASAPPPPVYNENTQPQKKGSKFGVGTGLAVGAVAGVLGGLALDEAFHYEENKIEDNAAEKVESDLAAQQAFDDYAGDDYGGGDDDY